MFRTVHDFLQVWEFETSVTERLFERLTPESLQFDTHHSGRGVARQAQHIAEAALGYFNTSGFHLDLHFEALKVPTDPASILADYREGAAAVVQEVKSWTDASLTEMVPFFGRMEMPRGSFLFSFVVHQAHHRGQLTILMREAGLVPTGIYGPTSEESQAMGIPVRP